MATDTASINTCATLLQNAVATITLPIHGNEPKNTVFEKLESYPNDPVIQELPESGFLYMRGSEPPARPPSALPPPGNLHLNLRLGKRIGSGRSGIVYEAFLCPEGSSPEVSSLFIPPLAAKISQRYRNEDLEHELYYYEEMESIQGIVVPRCYGLFQGIVPRAFSILPPDAEDAYDGKTSAPRPRNLSGIISVLLLERLGGHLPIGQGIPEGVFDEIMGMYLHPSELGIEHIDIRHANILYAPESPPGFPSLPSPLTGKVYRWRLIDFSSSYKTNETVEHMQDSHEDYVDRLLLLLPQGYAVEPWEI